MDLGALVWTRLGADCFETERSSPQTDDYRPVFFSSKAHNILGPAAYV